MAQKESSLRVSVITEHAWLPWVMLIGWMGLIFFFSHQPSLPHLPDGNFDLFIKKLAHASAYAMLMWLWVWALGASKSVTPKTMSLAFALTVLYAMSDEWHQSFVPGRHGQLADVLVDTAGALFFVIIFRRFEAQIYQYLPSAKK